MIWRIKYGGNKYKARSTIYNGKRYDSFFEAGYAQGLDMRKKAGEILDWESQITISFDINGIHICNYRCDFLIHHNDGSKEYVETKGKYLMNLDVFRIKRKLMEALFLHDNPECRYTIVTN